jgi:shikimate dehydrogenase
MIYAEVIGDPIVQSKSPIIHKHWLSQLRIEADYQRTRVAADDLATFLDRRRSDPEWRGSNVTIPHKERIVTLLDRIDPAAESIDAINVVVPLGRGLTGFNTDVDGIAQALAETEIKGRKIAVIGAGGAARALVFYLGSKGVGEIVLVMRDPSKVEGWRGGRAVPLDRCSEAFADATAIINASPLGMASSPAMPSWLLDSVKKYAAGITVFDMVTTPAETDFLSAGHEGGGRPVDGHTMLVGQAARAFELFFGAPAPAPDGELRDLLMNCEEVK